MSNEQIPNPPKRALQLLRWFCKPWYVEAIEGDLYELYLREYAQNPKIARRRFSWNVFRFFRWRYIKDFEDYQPKSSLGMFKTYFKVSLRNMLKHKTQSSLNIFGLAVGITCCMLILMHVSTQLKYDVHIPDLDRIYRVTLNNGGPYTPARLVKQMREDYPEIETGTRVLRYGEIVIELEGDYLRQDNVVIADSSFFDVFEAEFLFGNSKTSLNTPFAVVVTESVSLKLFKERNSVGKVIVANGDKYEIKAVVKDQPETSTIPYKVVVATPRDYWATTGWWTGNNFFSYLKVKENANVDLLVAKFPQFVEKYIAPELLKYNSQYKTFEEYLADNNNHFFSLVPMSEIFLKHSRLSLGKSGSHVNVIVFSTIALFILLIACVNYINMATARSSLRAKEIGMRKVLGSVKGLIAQQFLFESFIITLIAVLLSAVLGVLVLPYFNQISDSNYLVSDFINANTALWYLIILAAGTLISGSYPAIYLSSFKPITALRGETVRGGNSIIRTSLVVFQFAISIFLIAATLIVHKQITFMSDRKLGVETEQTFIVYNAGKVLENFDALKSELIGQGSIKEVGLSNNYPSSFMADWNYRTVGDDAVTVNSFNVFATPEILDVWGIKLKEGRFFEKGMVSDTSNVVVNAELAKSLGWDQPIGQTLSRTQGENYRVIGVVENFTTGSAKRGDYPLLFRTTPVQKFSDYGGGYLSLKIAGNYQDAISHAEKVWGKFTAKYPFDGIFLDDSFNRLYEGERKFGKLFTGFSGIAIIIACVGLFSLASFTLERRRKEIAIRKVMGANMGNVIMMVSKSFFILIFVSAAIALPLAFYLGSNWLEDYVYRIDISAFELVLPIILVLMIATLTIGYQMYRSAISNPANVLNEE